MSWSVSAAVDQVYHYPPELLNLLTDAVSNVVESKNDVITPFQGAGVPQKTIVPWSERVRTDPIQRLQS